MTPTEGPNLAIAAGSQNTAAIKSNGTVMVWGGDNVTGQNIPAGLSSVKAIAVGGYFDWIFRWHFGFFDQYRLYSSHIVALKNDGTVVAWGRDFEGQTNVPTGLTNVKAIAAGFAHTVALKTDGTVVAWGCIRPFASGDVNYGQCAVPAGLTNVAAIATGAFHTVALKTDGSVVSWGRSLDQSHCCRFALHLSPQT
jgi:alpha-tubulin suppressor-like RCC1 family protein